MMNHTILAYELQNDPTSLGYAGHLSAGRYDMVVGLLNRKVSTTQIPKTFVTPIDVLTAIAPGDLKDTTNADAAKWFRQILGRSSLVLVEPNGDTSPIGTGLADLITDGTDSKDRISSIGLRDGARSEQLFGPGVLTSQEDIKIALTRDTGVLKLYAEILASTLMQAALSVTSSGGTNVYLTADMLMSTDVAATIQLKLPLAAVIEMASTMTATLGVTVAPTAEDTFATDLAAGSVNGTYSTGRTFHELRTVIDTSSYLSISGGALIFNNTKALDGDPGIWYPAVTRSSGRALLLQYTTSTATGSGPALGYDANQSGSLSSFYFLQSSGVKVNGTTITVAPAAAINTQYDFWNILRSSGSWFLIKQSGGPKLFWLDSALNTSPMYPAAFAFNNTGGKINKVLIPKNTFIPTPLASDSFVRSSLGSTDGAGHAEANGGSGLAWQTGSNNTWAISGNKLVNTPTVGGDVYGGNGAFTTDSGYWSKDTGFTITGDGLLTVSGATGAAYRASSVTSGIWAVTKLDIKSLSSGSFQENAAGFTNAAASVADNIIRISRISSTTGGIKAVGTATGTVDNYSLSPLSTADLFCTVQASSPDVIMDIAISGTALGSSGIQAGLVLNLNSPSNPQHFIIIYFDGTGNIKVDKCVSGTYTNLASTAVTYGAGKVLRVMHDKSIPEYRIFYDNVAVGSVITENNTLLKDNTYFGTFATSSLASFSGFTVWARGTSNEYAALGTLE